MNIPHPLAEKRYNATLVDFKSVTSHLGIFHIKPDFLITDFKAGQFATIGLGSWEERVPGAQVELDLKEDYLGRRAYSISTPLFSDNGNIVNPADLPYLEFYVTLVLDGKDEKHAPYLTPRLFNLEVGDRLSIVPKIAGHYILEDIKPSDNIIFLATGTGQAPHNTMACELLRNDHQGKIILVECNRSSDMFGYSEKLKTLEERFTNVHYKQLMTREGDKPMRIQPYVSEGLLEEEFGIKISKENTRVFLCGNPAMIGIPTFVGDYPTFEQEGGIVELLVNKYGMKIHHGHSPGEIYYEKYW
ncbi:MAG: hypothetical protein NE328_00825 [Lentisphaeraceae bacterium]|nr:hypothetical protein [Lentisphaeraceae bacterium]